MLALLSTLSLQAQWVGEKIKGNGNYTTITRSVGDYDGIALSGGFDLEIVDGSEGKITIEGESNLLEYLVTEVKDGTLNVKTKKGYQLYPSNYSKGINITVPVEAISSVVLSGSGDIVGKKRLSANNFSTVMSGSGDITLEVEADEVSATLSGSGDINLSGKADKFSARISGSGDIKAYQLLSRQAEAVVAGSADIRLNVTESLKARVSGSGDIRYRGNPSKVDSKVAGSGDVEPE